MWVVRFELHERLSGGVLRSTASPRELRVWVARAVQEGDLRRVLPGIYAPVGSEHLLGTRCAAVLAADPDAVIAGRAAAALSWWPDLPPGPVTAYRRSKPAPRPGFRWLAGSVPPELVTTRGGARFTTPELTVFDLIPELHGTAIDEALRRRVVTLDSLERALALTPGRPGNVERRWLLDDSRDRPWSELERQFQRRYRGMGLPHSYRTNFPVDLGDTRAFIDCALPGLRLGFETDGHEHHGTRSAFEHDRRRDAKLAERQWHIVRLTWSMVEDPDLERLVRAIVAAREQALGLRPGAPLRPRIAL